MRSGGEHSGFPGPGPSVPAINRRQSPLSLEKFGAVRAGGRKKLVKNTSWARVWVVFTSPPLFPLEEVNIYSRGSGRIEDRHNACADAFSFTPGRGRTPSAPSPRWANPLPAHPSQALPGPGWTSNPRCLQP